MQRTTPPFRADMVGSLLRPAPLKEARGKFAKGEIDAGALKAIEDREIEKIVKKQEEVGLKLATDGEFRRSWWHFDFFWGLKGVERISAPPIKFHGVETKAEAIKITGKVDFTGHPQIEHFKFLKAHCRTTPKMCIPAPSTFHFRQGRAMVSKQVYPRLRRILRRRRRHLAQGDPRLLRRRLPLSAARRHRLGDDVRSRRSARARKRAATIPTRCRRSMRRVTREALRDKPADMAITMHSCRGNFRSTFIASGGYEFVAEQLLGHTDFDGYFLEYDSDRAGGFEPLRSSPRATSNWCSASSPRSRGGSSRATRSSAASRRRPNTSRSINCACRRNAASPRPRKATCWPRTSSGRS